MNPRGRTGFARATGVRELSFPEANFPRTKADIETWIVKCFFSSLKENGWEPFCLANPRQNEEQDFDYTVDSARETESGLLTSSSPADDASRKELAIVVRSAVQTLPDKLKAVILLADYEDLSHHEIAQILGCSAKAVETRLYRAHRILRGKLRDLFV
jgi:RNA polymerase sigma factor (sigma-70 family)